MTRRRAFIHVEPTARFQKRVEKLDDATQDQCRAALKQLLVDPLPVGLHFKPILPHKIFWEARINRSDRLIVLPEGPVAYIMDVVAHDEIHRWSR